MKLVLYLIPLLLLFSCTRPGKPKPWDDAYEAEAYRSFDAGIKPMMPDEDKRKALVKYIIKRLKKEIPKGMASVSEDSLKSLSAKIGSEYAGMHFFDQDIGILPMKRPWTKELEATIKHGWDQHAMKKLPNLTEADFHTMMAELKKIYPDSVVMPLPATVNERLVKAVIAKKQ